MARVLIWFALIALVWWAVKPRPRVPPPARPGAGGPGAAERMVDCARCGVHLPASESVRGPDGRDYCCAEHRAAGPR